MTGQLSRRSSRRQQAASPSSQTPMQAAFLAALRKRCSRGGQVTLPVGEVDAEEVGQVLDAIDRERRR